MEKSSTESDKDSFQQTIEELDKHLNNTDNLEVYKELLANNFHLTLIQMLKTFVDKREFKLINSICKFLSSATEYSEEFGEALVREDIPDLLITITITYGDSVFLTEVTDTVIIDNITYYVLHVTYHIIRHIRFQQCFLSHNNINKFKQTVLPWMVSKVINTRILATFVLTWLMKEDEEDQYIIEKHSDIVKNVCEYVKKALRNQDKYYRGYSLWELLQGLKALAAIDSIKVELINVDGFIPSLIMIINNDLSVTKEIETSVGILWSLTFEEKNKEILKHDYHIVDVVKHLSKTTKDDSIRRKVKGLLWELNKKRKNKCQEKSDQYDVFISYCHSQKESIALLATVLKKHFKVWIDTDNMKGSGLSDMATGIEQSTIFLMAVSSSYKQSQCCRSEANWAFKLNKPIIPLIMVHRYNPDGWLGMMISSETYVDFSDQSDFNDSSSKIIKHIAHKFSEANHGREYVSCSTGNNKDDDKVESLPVMDKSTNLPVIIRDWTSDDVCHWLSIHKLPHLCTKFVEFDGGMLLAMKNMMDKTYEKYNNHLEKKFKMSLTEILKFDSALASLKLC